MQTDAKLDSVPVKLMHIRTARKLHLLRLARKILARASRHSEKRPINAFLLSSHESDLLTRKRESKKIA